MHALQSLLLLGLPVAIVGSPALLPRAPTGPFTLYAYGEGIGGVPLFTSGSRAFVGNSSLSGDSEAAPVQFNTGTDDALLGSPNTTSTSSDPSWSNLTFMVPDTTSSTHNVGFTNSTPGSGMSATGFTFYGHVLLHQNDDGTLKSLFYAVPSDTEGIWSLDWNSTDDDTEGKVLLTVKATAPSKGMDETQ